MSREIAKMFIALPPDLKEWLQREAELQERSQNSIVVRTLRQARMDAEKREQAEQREQAVR